MIRQDQRWLRNHWRDAFTLVELLVVIVVLGVLVGLLLPATRSSREAARRMSCANNFKQVGLAIHNFHSAYKRVPQAMGGTAVNQFRLSVLVELTPFMEQQGLWNQISGQSTFDGIQYPAMGPPPWDQRYDPWRTEVPTLRCPSDPGEKETLGRTNYAFCIGDSAREIHQPSEQRGMFVCRKKTRFRDVLDGLSNTLAGGEIKTYLDDRDSTFATLQSPSILEDPQSCVDLRDPERPNYFLADVSVHEEGRGGRWADGAAGFTLFNTILPPNQASCAVVGEEAEDGVYATSSFHQGGSHVLMADGAVIFITDSIECGDSKSPSPSVAEMATPKHSSPYGLWGHWELQPVARPLMSN